MGFKPALALALVALSSCAAQRMPPASIKKQINETLIAGNKSFKTADNLGYCIINLYLGMENDNVASLLKTEYCVKGSLGFFSQTRWINENNDDRFEKVCWLNALDYEGELFSYYPEYCAQINISIDEQLFIEKEKYNHPLN